MTAVTPSRDALAKALCVLEDDCAEDAGWAVSCDHGFGYDKADALLASGAVIDATTLAYDEALVEAGARGFFENFDKTPRRWPAPEQHIPWWTDRSRDVIRALAAALTERGEQHG